LDGCGRGEIGTMIAWLVVRRDRELRAWLSRRLSWAVLFSAGRNSRGSAVKNHQHQSAIKNRESGRNLRSLDKKGSRTRLETPGARAYIHTISRMSLSWLKRTTGGEAESGKLEQKGVCCVDFVVRSFKSKVSRYLLVGARDPPPQSGMGG